MSFRADPGIGHEMKERMGEEKDLYTLFSVATEQAVPMDIRRIAANRLNDFNGQALEFIRTEANPAMLEDIANSHLFPSWFNTFARAAIKGKSAEELLLAALMEQNRLLRARKKGVRA